MKTITKLTATVLAFSMSVSTATFSSAFAVEEALSPYVEILDEFNEEYGTSYQLATPVQLDVAGESVEQMTDFFNDMSESEFYDYLYDAYLIDLSDESNYEQVCADEFDSSIELGAFMSYSTPDIINQTNNTGTQHYYYRGSDKQSLYITASWTYGDGYNRYSKYLDDIGATYTDGVYPYYAPYDSTYSLANYSREMDCTFYCTRYVAKYVTQGNYIIPVTFVAGGGDIWGTVDL